MPCAVAIGSSLLGIVLGAGSPPEGGPRAKEPDVRWTVDEAKTDAYIAALDLEALERAGCDFVNARFDPTRIGKEHDEIDRACDYDFEQLLEVERRLEGVDRRRVLAHIFRATTDGATTNTEKHVAILRFLHRATNHSPWIRPRYPDCSKCLDPLIILELGETRCGQAARLACDLFDAAGYRTRCVGFGGHVSAEIYYDDDWHFFDADSSGNGLTVTMPDGTIPSVVELSRRPELIDRLAHVYELNYLGGPTMSGSAVRSTNCFRDRGDGKPKYFTKRRPPVAGEFNYGWHNKTKEPADWTITDGKPRYQPGAVEIDRVRIEAGPTAGRVTASIEWRPAHDADGDLIGYRVYVGSAPRGWNYMQFAGTPESKRYWSSGAGWKPEMYAALFTMPPGDVAVIRTTEPRVALEYGCDETRYVTIMPFDEYHEQVGKTMYYQSNELRIDGRDRGERRARP